MNKKGKTGQFAIEIACNNSDIQMIKLLLENGCDPNVSTNVLVSICQHNNRLKILKSLITYGFDMKKFINEMDDKYCVCMFLCLCYYCDLKCLKYLIKLSNNSMQFNINTVSCDNKLRNGLHLCISNKNTNETEKYKFLQYLLKKVYFSNENMLNKNGIAVINAKDIIGAKPLHYAAIKKYNCIIKLLLNYQIWRYDDNISARIKYNEVKSYCENELQQVVECDLYTNIELNLNDHSVYQHDLIPSPLMISIVMTDIESVKLLLQHQTSIFIVQDKLPPIPTHTHENSHNDTQQQNSAALQIDKQDKHVNNQVLMLIPLAIDAGNVQILKMVLRFAMFQAKVTNWESLNASGILTMLTHYQNNVITANKTRAFINDIINDEINEKNFDYICSSINYQIIPNLTVFVTKYNKNNSNKTRNDVNTKQEYKGNVLKDRWRVGKMLKQGKFITERNGIDNITMKCVRLKFIQWKHDKVINEYKETVNNTTAVTTNNRFESLQPERDENSNTSLFGELKALIGLSLSHECNCPNILKLFCYNLNIDNFDNKSMYYNAMLVFEHASFGELTHFLSVTTSFDDSLIKSLLNQILNGLNVIHNILKLNHNSLKLSTLLVCDKYSIKISDFTMSGVKHTTSRKDMFDLGIILWKMMFGLNSIPFDSNNNSNTKNNSNNSYSERIKQLNISTTLKSLFTIVFSNNDDNTETPIAKKVQNSEWYKITNQLTNSEYIHEMDLLFDKVQETFVHIDNKHTRMTQKEMNKMSKKLFKLIRKKKQEHKADEFETYFQSILKTTSKRDLNTVFNKRYSSLSNKKFSTSTLLMAGVIMNNIKIVNVLLKLGTPILNVNEVIAMTKDHRDNKKIHLSRIGNAALHDACSVGNNEMIELLCKYRADTNIENNNTSETPLTLLCKHGNVQSLQLLHNYGCNFDTNDNNSNAIFLRLCKFGHVDALDYFLKMKKKENDNVNIFECKDDDNYNGLHWGVKNQHLNMVKYLCENVDFKILTNLMNGKTKYFNMTPCHFACAQVSNNSLVIFTLLVQYKCNLKICDDNGWLPLHFACSEKNFKVLEYILDENLYDQKDLHILTNDGESPIQLFQENIHQDCSDHDIIDRLKIKLQPEYTVAQ